jgi:ligand-binding sensor domain-containing protein
MFLKSPRHIHSDAEHLVFWGQWVIIGFVHLLLQSFIRPAGVVRFMGRVLAALVLLVQVVANGAATGTSDYLIDVWTGDSGLPNGSVTAIAQTPEGYLWVGTLNGLARFDGVRFVTYEPLNTPELKHALTPITNWTLLGSGVFSGGAIVVDDLQATNHMQRYYLIRIP